MNVMSARPAEKSSTRIREIVGAHFAVGETGFGFAAEAEIRGKGSGRSLPDTRK